MVDVFACNPLKLIDLFFTNFLLNTCESNGIIRNYGGHELKLDQGQLVTIFSPLRLTGYNFWYFWLTKSGVKSDFNWAAIVWQVVGENIGRYTCSLGILAFCYFRWGFIKRFFLFKFLGKYFLNHKFNFKGSRGLNGNYRLFAISRGFLFRRVVILFNWRRLHLLIYLK